MINCELNIPKKERIFISKFNVTGNYNNRAGLLFSPSLVIGYSSGERKFFYDLEAAAPYMEYRKVGRYKMCELLDPEVLPKVDPKVNADLL